mgnify:FL=1
MVENHHAAFSRYKGYFMEQQKHNIRVCLADICLDYALRYPETKKYFEKYICAEPSETADDLLAVTDELWERHKNVAESSISEAYTEFYALLGTTSRALLKYGKCLFHGVAFLWHDRAWIITAPSGTGKTTQLRLWQKLFGVEIEVINGDKPVMECREDDSVWIYPSPWNGKENLSGTKSGRLAGIIYLEQADHNEVSRMDIRSSILPIYRQFLYYGDYEEEIREVGHMLDTVLRNIPVWKLSNLGDEASAELTHNTLLHYLED